MERVLVICGAGASSTFLAHWMRKGATERGLDVSIEPASTADLESRYRDLDVVLVGQHLEPAFADILRAANEAGVRAALLPAISYDAHGAATALDILSDLRQRPLASARATDENPSRREHD